MAKGVYQLPFRDGALLHYPDYPTTTINWCDNHTMSATLTFQGFERGRSAAYAIWQTGDGKPWPMFLKDLGDVLARCDVRKASVTALWTFCKRGANYGIRLAD